MIRQRMIPHPFVTFALVAAFFAGAAGSAALLVWGTSDGIVAELVAAATGIALFVFGVVIWFRTTAILGDGRVRSGWPRSRWWHSADVAEVRKLYGSGGIRICSHVGEASALLVVPSDLIGLSEPTDRGQIAVDQVLLALGLNQPESTPDR